LIPLSTKRQISMKGNFHKESSVPISTQQRQDWRTPDNFFDYCAFRFGPYTLDAAASRSNARCKRFYTEKDDGLIQPWGKNTVWCNPPYKRGSARGWLQKAHGEMQGGGTRSSLLLPANTSAKWFHDFAVGKCQVFLVKGRLAFDNTVSTAPFSSVLCVFDPNEKPTISTLTFKEFTKQEIK